MPKYTFKIAEAFPEQDPVARFVTVLAMVINDWHRTMALMVSASEADPEGKEPETRGVRLHARQRGE